MTPEELLKLANDFKGDQGWTGRDLALQHLAEGYLALSVKLEAAEQERDEGRKRLAILDRQSDVQKRLSVAGEEAYEREHQRPIEASRGEVVKACPKCDGAKELTPSASGEDYYCFVCRTVFTEPAYWQRVNSGSETRETE